MGTPIKVVGKSNPRLKAWRAVGAGKNSELFFMEHREAVLESLDGPISPKEVLLSEELYQQDMKKWDSLAAKQTAHWHRLPKALLDRVTSVRSSSGLCALYEMPHAEWDTLSGCDFLLIAWELQDPGNLGTLIRSCSALTGGGLIQFGGCSPWSAKVARASAGAVLRIPVFRARLENADSMLAELRNSGRQMVSLMPRGGEELSALDWNGPVGLVVGHETRGVPESVQKITNSVTIPMSGGGESMNAGVAGSLACYEWSRARQSKAKRIPHHG